MKVLFAIGASALFSPVIAPSCTLQFAGKPDQPLSVLPSKMLIASLAAPATRSCAIAVFEQLELVLPTNAQPTNVNATQTDFHRDFMSKAPRKMNDIR